MQRISAISKTAEAARLTLQRLIAALAGCALACSTALAQDHEDDEDEAHVHTHVPVEIDASLGWADIIEAALATHPMRYELGARATEADIWQRRAGSWLAGAPSVYASYLSDGPRDNVGQREYEAGVELPLLKPAQRAANRELAGTLSQESDAAEVMLRWQVVGTLRGLLWDIEAASTAHALAEAQLEVAETVERTVERMTALGELARADLLLAQSATLGRRAHVIETEAELLDGERAYRALTGLDHRPESVAEHLVRRDTFDDGHPALAFANADVRRAEASVDQAQRAAKGNLSLTAGPRRQRDPFGTIYTDSIGVGISVPIGGGRMGAAASAVAVRALGDAQTRRAALLRQMDLDLHEAEHIMSVVTESLELAERNAELTSAQVQMAQSAFENGEIELRELLRIQSAANDAMSEAARLRIERLRAIAAVNQALGELP
jgi:outer membrane protein TolC